MRDARGPDPGLPTPPRDARGETAGGVPARVLLAPHGGGWRAESTRIYVWQESREEAESWARALARAPR
jgi:hypothetical protein